MRWTLAAVTLCAACGGDDAADDGSTRVLVFAEGPTTIEHVVGVGDNLTLAGVTSDTALWIAKLAKGGDAVGWEQGVTLTASSPAGNAFAASSAGELAVGRDGTLAALAASGKDGTGATLGLTGFGAAGATAEGGLAIAGTGQVVVLDPSGAPKSGVAFPKLVPTGIAGTADGGLVVAGALDAGGFAIARLAPDLSVTWSASVGKPVKRVVELAGGDVVVLGPTWLARLGAADGAIAWQESLAVAGDATQTIGLADITVETSGDSLAAIGVISGGATPQHFVAHLDPATGAVTHGLAYTTLVGDTWREVGAFGARTIVVGDSSGHGLVLWAGDDPGRCFSGVALDTLVAMPASETSTTQPVDATAKTVGMLPAADLALAAPTSSLSRSCVMANP